MNTTTKVLTSLLLITAVGVGIASAQNISTGTTTTNASVQAGARFANFKKLKDLSADVKAQLETARKNKDFAQVNSILESNGITMPKLTNRMDKKQNRVDRRTTRKTDKTAMKNLSDDVKAQLKTAREAKDFDKVKSILEANGITMPANFVPNHENRAAFQNLSADVQAQLKEAFKARDMAKVKSILEANGIATPAASLNSGTSSTPAVQSSTSAQ